jgi:hypothetical protein
MRDFFKLLSPATFRPAFSVAFMSAILSLVGMPIRVRRLLASARREEGRVSKNKIKELFD